MSEDNFTGLNKYFCIIKIIVDVGKTTILLTFINDKYPDKTMNTLGSSFHTHEFMDT